MTVARLVLVLALGTLETLTAGPVRVEGSATPGACVRGILAHGALSLICVPSTGWNGDLVIWAHGYVAFQRPLDFYHLVLPDGVPVPLLAQALGYAFATTSYRSNGLVILESADDILELIAAFAQAAGRPPARTYLVGVSEGGLVTALLLEQAPRLFSGGLAACGPIAGFRDQINYVGDFRVLFDYFFPGVIPGSPLRIPPEVMDSWEPTYVPAVVAALIANPGEALELMRTSSATVDPANLGPTVVATTLNLLWYNVFGTNDAVARLGGNPYGNQGRWYRGSSDDPRLNARVQRFVADGAALEALSRYRTSGNVTVPLVTLHTTEDEVVPLAHELLYLSRAFGSGHRSVTPLAISRYGHCNFTTAEAVAAFVLLVSQVTGAQPPSAGSGVASDPSTPGRR